MRNKEIELLKNYGKKFDLPMTKCSKCKKLLDIRVTTELTPEEENKSKIPQVLIIMGLCKKCEIIYVLKVIPFKKIPKYRVEKSKGTGGKDEMSKM